MTPSKGHMTRAAAALAAVVALAVPAFAQDKDYSSVNVPATITIIVASSPGGSSDALVRVTAPIFEAKIEEMTGSDIATVVKNMPGAGTEVGATALAGATPDGSTIGLMNLPHFPLLEAARDTQFEPWLEAFTPLGLNVFDANVFILGKSSSFATVAEALDAAKADPGSVIVGAQGPLSDDQLALHALERDTGAKFAFIPYAGGSDANRALMGGEIDVTIGNIFDYIQLADSAKDAAIFSTERAGMIPDVPTFAEAVGVETGNLGSTRGFGAPSGLPEDLLDLYRDAFARTFADPAYVEEAMARNITLIKPKSAEEFGAIMVEQQELVGSLIEVFRDGGYLN
ncbi:tripartite tricarboxylate transporter substrate binding protein [Salipiger sp.]|uniref:tripartite tricarboxylate transporter substrate binding protein n=1 Tax=Salipiger sp. TaxID=2078585 RepID=UPI003A979A10